MWNQQNQQPLLERTFMYHLTYQNPVPVTKKESTPNETTYQGKTFTPLADIFESKQNLVLVLDMPGVSKDLVQVKLENDLLEVEGRVNVNELTAKTPIYSEYNVGHYYRRFAISNKINRDQIEAKMTDGVLTLTLPKLPEKSPKKIPIS